MSRCGYSDDLDTWALVCWRGAVKRAVNGKRGQSFLKEMLETLEAMPVKKLIKGELITTSGEVCAIGSVMKKRGIDVTGIDLEDADYIANKCGIAASLVKEIEYINDDAWSFGLGITDEARYNIVHNWVKDNIKE